MKPCCARGSNAERCRHFLFLLRRIFLRLLCFSFYFMRIFIFILQFIFRVIEWWSLRYVRLESLWIVWNTMCIHTVEYVNLLQERWIYLLWSSLHTNIECNIRIRLAAEAKSHFECFIKDIIGTILTYYIRDYFSFMGESSVEGDSVYILVPSRFFIDPQN